LAIRSPPSTGNAVDVLALDRDGNLVILELRGRTSRDVVAQVLDYASWAHGLEDQDIVSIAETYHKKPLEGLFKDRFRTELPQPLNEKQRLVIVATELDPQLERIVQFLSSQYGININVVFFNYYRHGDQKFVGRSWLIAPEEVKRKADTRGPTGRHSSRSASSPAWPRAAVSATSTALCTRACRASATRWGPRSRTSPTAGARPWEAGTPWSPSIRK
jgi:hypothetical protein